MDKFPCVKERQNRVNKHFTIASIGCDVYLSLITAANIWIIPEQSNNSRSLTLLCDSSDMTPALQRQCQCKLLPPIIPSPETRYDTNGNLSDSICTETEWHLCRLWLLQLPEMTTAVLVGYWHSWLVDEWTALWLLYWVWGDNNKEECNPSIYSCYWWGDPSNHTKLIVCTYWHLYLHPASKWKSLANRPECFTPTNKDHDRMCVVCDLNTFLSVVSWASLHLLNSDTWCYKEEEYKTSTIR